MKNLKFATKAVHGTWEPDGTGSTTLPIYQTNAYDLGGADRAADLFGLKEFGNIYTRINNPTNSAFEEKVNLLEGGVGALSTASGQAAITIALLNICTIGDHFIATTSLYGGTHTLFTHTFKKFGVEVTLVSPSATNEEIKSLVKENTKAIYGESIGNPALDVLDIQRFADVAHSLNIPLIIDNTFPSPYLLRPFEHGADIVIHSATKYLGGHGNSIGGIIVDSGNFDWTKGNFPGITEPDPSYHGIKYAESFGNLSYIVKARVQLLRDLGSTLSPFNSFLFHLGLETLPLRMDKHSENALALAKHLEKNPSVEWVNYPGLDSHPTKALTDKYLPNGASGMLTFGLKGGRLACKNFVNSVKLARLVANLGDTRTLVAHPSSTTHSQLTDQEQIESGVLPELIRVTVGIEDIEDIIADFEQAITCKGEDTCL